MTVLGEIKPNDLGIVLPHEHFLWDQKCWGRPEPRELWQREVFRQRVTLENRGKVMYHTFDYPDNLVQTDVSNAIAEAMKFKLAGGKTICDVTPASLGRDPLALREIALSTGLNIIKGSSLYVASSWSEDEKIMTVEQIRDGILKEFGNGIGDTGIKPGILGEVGVSHIDNPFEILSLKASGMVQKEIGCPVIIHTPIWDKEGNSILDILEKSGANPRKVALSHLDPTCEDYDYADSLAKRGAYIVYDQFGLHVMTYEGLFLPSDNDRIRAVVEQVKRGNLENILISQDICFKIVLTQWGGHGYAHILENIVPRLLKEGLTREEVDTILIENPKRFLSW